MLKWFEDAVCVMYLAVHVSLRSMHSFYAFIHILHCIALVPLHGTGRRHGGGLALCDLKAIGIPHRDRLVATRKYVLLCLLLSFI